MRMTVTKKPRRPLLRWAQRLLLAVAVSLLGYGGFVLADAWIFQKLESRHLKRQLGALVLPAATRDGLVGRLEIPSLDFSAVVVEGIDSTTLRRAVGHIPGTALPGQPGNVGIAGHRGTFFRPLRNIHRNDIITLTTLQGQYRYRVVSTSVVSPADVAVLDPAGDEILTLVTCHPFYFVGSAPDRFIVRAERVAGPAENRLVTRAAQTGPRP